MFLSPFSDHIMGSLWIEIKTFFTYAAMAAAVTAVIENENADPSFMK